MRVAYPDVARTTLQIDDDVYEGARDVARRERRSSGAVISELARWSLQPVGERRSSGAVISELARRSLQPVGVTDDHGFPVFDVPRDAPRLVPEDVVRAAEDG